VAFADNSNVARASDDDARNAWVNADFLFESVVCDLHLAALTAGGFAMLLTARSLADTAWTLRSWRSVLIDDGQTMRLTLRFRCDMGMSAATAARFTRALRERKPALPTTAGFPTGRRRRAQRNNGAALAPSSNPRLRP
jgi:hypothetical protein